MSPGFSVIVATTSVAWNWSFGSGISTDAGESNLILVVVHGIGNFSGLLGRSQRPAGRFGAGGFQVSLDACHDFRILVRDVFLFAQVGLEVVKIEGSARFQ